jgi:hypothetical protein
MVFKTGALGALFILLGMIIFSESLAAPSPTHDSAFWKSIVDHDFAVPAMQSAGALALEITDLAGSTDPKLRDNYGYEILAAWIYRDHRLRPDELEALRRKLLPAITSNIGESNRDTIFRRSFSALYMSILAAEDLKKSFLSTEAFNETLDTALRCYREEKDLRGYVSQQGWAHATAHVADLLKFLGRNEKLSPEQQKRIVRGIAERCRSAGIVFTWGEDARMAAALLSLTNRNDFAAASFDDWFKSIVFENKEIWKTPVIDPKAYASVRAQANVLTHFSAKMAAQKETHASSAFRDALNAALLQVNWTGP